MAAPASGAWRAWIDRAPGGGPTLHVAGTCTLPTPGHTAALAPAEPPGPGDPDDLRLRLDVHPPDGPVAQVLTDVAVAWSAPAGRAYATVSIDGIAAAIPVETEA
jgi:hypothetical protein